MITPIRPYQRQNRRGHLRLSSIVLIDFREFRLFWSDADLIDKVALATSATTPCFLMIMNLFSSFK